MWTVADLATDLQAGRTTSRELVEQALARIEDPRGEGGRAFLKVYAGLARAEADHSDRLRCAGVLRSPVEGLPVSVKDLFDVGGDVTLAGSRAFTSMPAAPADSLAVARLRAAGGVILGRTHMVEFAFGGVGLNAHHATPRNPWNRGVGHVPGGSSSGAAVAQADGMCAMALGTDTRGSIRIPAALCGVAGFKPTARRVPRDGVFPLSSTLDSVGPLANTIRCCAEYDAILAGEPVQPLAALSVPGLRLMLPQSIVLQDLDADVGRAFESALSRLSRAGALIQEVALPLFDAQQDYFREGGLAGAEAAAVHRPYAALHGQYDPRVRQRVGLGSAISGADYAALQARRAQCARELDAIAAPFDALLMPSVACIAPSINEANADDDAYFRWNTRLLRNAGLVNFFDGCAATLPCHEPGTAPVGLGVMGTGGRDRHILAVAAAIEEVLARRPGGTT
jgi:aspartyl-tRNA(Asn)/glutamyl-tRNA(Gln) amidotransferase subunit A